MATDTESMHALAFLYLTFSHATDGALSGDEMRAVAGKLKEWNPEASLEELGAVLKNTVEEYKALPSRTEKYEAASKCAEQLKGTADSERLQTVVSDLASLAMVDGKVSDEEKAFIAQTAQTLGVESPV
jgi:uncharacterized tellurite resistance protein B-like protein